MNVDKQQFQIRQKYFVQVPNQKKMRVMKTGRATQIELHFAQKKAYITARALQVNNSTLSTTTKFHTKSI